MAGLHSVTHPELGPGNPSLTKSVGATVRDFGKVSVRGVHFDVFVRRRGIESITRPEEVSMHPMMIMTLAGEVERERQRERQTVLLRSPARARRAHSFDGSHAASGFTRRLRAATSLRPRLS